MARKSRKNAAAEPVCEAAPLQIFPTAIYARLSVENSGKSEKVDVITNQIEICKSYIAGCPYLDLVDVYVDNGRTGTVFDRPEFNRLMTDIEGYFSEGLHRPESADGARDLPEAQSSVWLPVE